MEDAYHTLRDERICDVSYREVVHFPASCFYLRMTLCVNLSVGIQQQELSTLSGSPTTQCTKFTLSLHKGTCI